MIRIDIHITIICLMVSTSVLSQTICDSITKKPIEFVNIVSDLNIGTISNEEGFFSADYFGDFKFLEISHIAYKPKKINNKYLKNLDTIYLEPSIINLNEVVLNKFNAKDTILKAIKKIPLNYSETPFNLYGFYRESTKEDNIGVQMTEVSFITQNQNSNNSYSAEIVQGRRSENYTHFGLNFIGGIISIIQKGDVVRQKKHVFDVNKISNYLFKYGGSIESNSKTIYIINYEPSDDDIYNNRIGQVFIESDSLAIIQINNRRDEEKVGKIIETQMPNTSNLKKAIYMLEASESTIRYKKFKDKYYLSFITATNKLKGALKRDFHSYEINAKLLVTKIVADLPKKVKTNYNINKDFNLQVKKIPQLDFWSENNTLYFTEREKQILKDLKYANKK